MAWTKKGFENHNKINCYANATLQCLLEIKDITNVLEQENGHNFSPILTELKTLHLKQINSQHQLLSANSLRAVVGPPFETDTQQDCVEFLQRLIATNELKQTFNFNTQTTIRCNYCRFISVNESTENIQFISLAPFEKTVTFAHLIKYYEEWFPIENGRCENCNIINHKEMKTEIVERPKVLIICLIPKFINGRRIQPSIISMSTKNVSIHQSNYSLIGSIQHYGNSPESGHYTAIIKDEDGWILCNDETCEKRKRYISGLKNVYVLFFQKDNTHTQRLN